MTWRLSPPHEQTTYSLINPFLFFFNINPNWINTTAFHRPFSQHLFCLLSLSYLMCFCLCDISKAVHRDICQRSRQLEGNKVTRVLWRADKSKGKPRLSGGNIAFDQVQNYSLPPHGVLVWHKHADRLSGWIISLSIHISESLKRPSV